MAKRHKPDHPEGERTSDNATEGLDLSSTLETRPRLSLTVEDGMRKLTASKELIDAQVAFSWGIVTLVSTVSHTDSEGTDLN